MNFLLITNNIDVAKNAFNSGIKTIFVDLETLGKHERQKNINSWKSNHEYTDIFKIRKAVPQATLLVRVNPKNQETKNEIMWAIDSGADQIMVPMFRTLNELDTFFKIANGRAEIVPLVETAEALQILPQIINQFPLQKIHIGLNDLHLDLKLKFMFQVMSEGLLEIPCSILRKGGIEFGIGGLARVGEGLVIPELLIGEHVRLGSSSTILSRTFCRNPELSEGEFSLEVRRLSEIYNKFIKCGEDKLEQNRIKTWAKIQEVISSM